MTATLDPLVAPAKPASPTPPVNEPVRLTVEQFYDAQAAGIFPSNPTNELYDGVVYRRIVGDDQDPYVMKVPHANAVDELADRKRDFKSNGCFLWVQLPIVMKGDTLLFPDAAVVQGDKSDLVHGNPQADRVIAVVEVADASLGHDRTEKLRRYAAAGITTYLIVNLPKRNVQVLGDPDADQAIYNRSEKLEPGQTLRLPTATDATVDVPVADLFLSEDKA